MKTDIISTDVHYTIKVKDENTYMLTVIADKEWIESEERVFPVVVYPTVHSHYHHDT